VRERTAIAQERFGVAIEDAHRELRAALHHLEELARVQGLADGAGRDGHDSRRPALPRQRGHAGDCFARPLHRVGREAARLAHAGA